MGTNHEGLLDPDPGAIPGRDQLERIGRGQGERLLAENVLARLRRLHRPGNVQMVGQRIVDGVDVRIGQELLVGTVALRYPQRLGGRGGARRISRGDRGHLRKLTLLHRRDNLLNSYLRDSKDSPPDLGTHISILTGWLKGPHDAGRPVPRRVHNAEAAPVKSVSVNAAAPSPR